MKPKPMKLELIWAGVIAVIALVALLYLGRNFSAFETLRSLTFDG